jgi:hypothetical protein
MAGVRFDGTITLGNLLTALSMGVGLFVYAMTVETRLTTLKDKDIELEKRIERDTKLYMDSLGEIKTGLHRIEDKLDKKADK